MTNTFRAAAFLDKGGTGKTTTVAHLGVALQKQGYQVLLIDLAGKQGDLGKHFGVWSDYQDRVSNDDAWPNISTVFDASWETIVRKLGADALDEFTISTAEGPELIPAHPGLDMLDTELGNVDDPRQRYTRLESFLDEYIDPLGYDAVLIDLPGVANNVSYNGLWAARNVIVPVEMGPFEAEQIEALKNDLQKMRDNFSIDTKIELVIPNKVDKRTNLAEHYLEKFSETYPSVITPGYVPYSQDIRNATERGRTAFALKTPSDTARQARETYLEAAEQIIARLTEGEDANA